MAKKEYAHIGEYHSSFPEENLDRFEDVRKFARYNIGNPVVLFAVNKMIFHFDERKDDITINMFVHEIDFINRKGFYHLFFCGKHLFLQVLPLTSQIAWPTTLREMIEISVIPLDQDCKLKELTNIREFDMFYTTLSPKIFYRNGKYIY